MADIAIFRINYKSDFILTLQSDAGWMTPFCIKFWTGAPSQAYYAYYDGMSYTHCTPVEGDPTKLLVQFDDHHLPIGDLKFQIGYHFTVADFPTSIEDEVINQASVIIEVDDAPAQVMLDFNGETAPEIEFSLPAYANEAQRIANEQARIAAEEQRIANEQARISAEETRQANEQQRINAEAERVSDFASLKTESEAATAAANIAATLANEKAQLADDKAALAQAAATLANAKAQLAADKAALAQAAATLANEKAALAQQKAEYAQEQGDAAKTEAETAHALNEEVREDEEARDHAEQTRQQQEAARQTAESQRVTDFNTQMQQQQTAYTEAEAARETAFNEAEHQRDAKVNEKVADITNLQAQVGYFACDTAAATAAKTIAATGYALTKGGNIRIKMTNDNTVNNATLNINSTGAKPLFYEGARASSTNTWAADDVLEIYYDGTNYQAKNVSPTFKTGEKVSSVGVDDEPTAGSNNLVKSGGVFNAKDTITLKVIARSGLLPRLLVGEYGFNSSTKKILYKTGESTYVYINPNENAIYIYGSNLMIWDGTDLVNFTNFDNTPTVNSENLVKSKDLFISKDVIYLKIVDSSNVVPRLSVGEYGFNKYTGKILYKINGEGTYKIIDPQINAVYYDDYYIYKWNGTSLTVLFSVIEKDVINIVAWGNTSVLSSLSVGEYAWMTQSKRLIYKKDEDNSYVTLEPSKNAIYLYQGLFYLWNGIDLVKATNNSTLTVPFYELKVDHSFKNIESIYNTFQLSTLQERLTVIEQVYSHFDALAMSYPDYITKYDPMADSDITATETKPAIYAYNSIKSKMISAGYNDYPFYAKGISEAAEMTFTYPNGNTITKTYEITPEYKTYIYRINYYNRNIHRENAVKIPIVLTGGVHPNEIVQPIGLFIMAKLMLEDFDINQFALASIFDIYIIPCVGGYSMFHGTRYNANNVNINRNFDIRWTESGNFVDDPEKYSGPYAGSEFETQLLMAITKTIIPRLVVDCHNYGNNAYQFFNICTSPDYVNCAYQALIDCCYTFIKELPQYFGNKIKLFIDASNGQGQSPATISMYNGTFKDWVYENISECKVAATVEVGHNIAYTNGELQERSNFMSINTFKIAEYTLRANLYPLINYYLTHKNEES